ncbi:protein rep, partial [Clostridium tarantellae]
RANFCKDRLCPMCCWRRSLKIFGQVSKVMNKTLENNDYRFIFLTLTVKNCEGFELSDEIDKLFLAFKKLTKRKEFKIVKGWFRGLEVTHNLNKYSKDYDTYHPHFHIILMVNKSYFTDTKQYISQKNWTVLWKDCLNIDYNPIVNVKAFKTSTKNIAKKSVAEVAKYTVKDNDYLIKDQVMTDSSVMILNNALKGRRLIAFGKDFRSIHKLLNLDDAENGDLVNTDSEELIREDLDSVIEVYKWNIGLKEYIKL